VSEPVALVALPHAGGSISTFRPLADRVRPWMRWCGVELPGHGRRMQEPLLSSLDAMAEQVIAEIRPTLDAGPYALFGHSMGALLAHRVALSLHRQQLPLPLWLFVSGCAAPGRARLAAGLADLEGERFWRGLARYDGLGPAFLASRELQTLFEPILRADLRAVAQDRPPAAARLPVPILVLAGADDGLPRADLAAWQTATTEPLEIRTFPGGHFYLLEHAALLADLIITRCVCPVA
jgi:surfactin synthase thioesterase subunit